MCLNPFCFRATAELHEHGFETRERVSIPFASGLLLNGRARGLEAGCRVSIPFASGLLLNASVAARRRLTVSQSLLLQGYC